MRQYFKARGELLAVASTIGVPTAAIWFVYKSAETWNYFDVSYLHRFVFYLCAFGSFLPSLAIYVALYIANRFLIHTYGRTELRAKETEILTALISAYLKGGVEEKNERNLLEERAWARLKAYWVPCEV